MKNTVVILLCGAMYLFGASLGFSSSGHRNTGHVLFLIGMALGVIAYVMDSAVRGAFRRQERGKHERDRG